MTKLKPASIFLFGTLSTQNCAHNTIQNPRVVFSTDNQALRSQYLETTASHALLNRPKERKHVGSPVRRNPQLRDRHVKDPEAQVHKHLGTVLNRSQKPANDPEVPGTFDPVLITTSTVYSPTKGGCPRDDLRPVPKRHIIARDQAALEAVYQPVLDATIAAMEVLGRKPTMEEIQEFLPPTKVSTPNCSLALARRMR